MGRSWGECWKCHAVLGCTTCTTGNGREVLCKRCGAWGTKEAFQAHGPIVSMRYGQPARFGEYPPDWRVGYEGVSGGVPTLGEIVKTAMGRE